MLINFFPVNSVYMEFYAFILAVSVYPRNGPHQWEKGLWLNCEESIQRRHISANFWCIYEC